MRLRPFLEFLDVASLTKGLPENPKLNATKNLKYFQGNYLLIAGVILLIHFWFSFKFALFVYLNLCGVAGLLILPGNQKFLVAGIPFTFQVRAGIAALAGLLLLSWTGSFSSLVSFILFSALLIVPHALLFINNKVEPSPETKQKKKE
eukprot:TRINITY_DN5444_c0_g1_i1.p1 TRINITY_DN5444_c0_g1~~TRINITY_DN5444_c0_g1_i1.p1  ORF type:complete len:166 (-),score=37.77 TRINITY_DN5444_c0_g1_i1:409-852(-)